MKEAEILNQRREGLGVHTSPQSLSLILYINTSPGLPFLFFILIHLEACPTLINLHEATKDVVWWGMHTVVIKIYKERIKKVKKGYVEDIKEGG